MTRLLFALLVAGALAPAAVAQDAAKRPAMVKQKPVKGQAAFTFIGRGKGKVEIIDHRGGLEEIKAEAIGPLLPDAAWLRGQAKRTRELKPDRGDLRKRLDARRPAPGLVPLPPKARSAYDPPIRRNLAGSVTSVNRVSLDLGNRRGARGVSVRGTQATKSSRK